MPLVKRKASHKIPVLLLGLLVHVDHPFPTSHVYSKGLLGRIIRCEPRANRLAFELDKRIELRVECLRYGCWE